MNRILLSIGSIGVVTAIAAGAAGMTGAFFSDTETSSNNIFTAGSIDLKIDHSLSSYNGTQTVSDLEVVSDTQTTFTGDNGAGNAVLLSFVHPAWTAGASMPNAKWIWATNPVSNPTVDQTNTFTRTFIWNGPVTSASMKFAADNYYHVVLNGNVVGDNQSLIVDNFQNDHQTDVTSFIVQGVNTITFVAKNEHVDGSTPDANPAGIIYQLTIHGSGLSSDPIDLPGTPFWNFPDVKPQDEGRDVFSLHVSSNDAWACLVIKNVKNDENTLIEPEATDGDVTPGAAGIGGGELGNYLNLFLWRDLNNDGIYQPGSGETALSQGLFGNGLVLPIHDSTTANGPLVANTPEDIGAAWCAGTQTVNNTTGVITCDGSTMSNVSQTDSLAADLEFYATQQRNQPSFKCSDIDQNTVKVGSNDLETVSLANAKATNKWFFYNDTNDTIMTINQFAGAGGTDDIITGPGAVEAAAMVLDTGVNPRYNIATYKYSNIKLNTITSLGYRVYDATSDSDKPFLNFNVSFDGLDTFQKRLVYVPTTLPVGVWTTVDAYQGGAALWLYSGAFWPAGVTTVANTIPGTTARSWSSILADYPNIQTRVSDSWLGVRVGEPGPAGATGYVDWINFNGETTDFGN